MSSFSTEEKLDLLIKKIAFGKAKTETSENTDPFGEATASPLLLRADKLWRESGNIPSSPPGADTSQVELYTGADTVECTAVSAAQNTNISGFKRSWTTGHTDWIPPEFGANYLVKVYVGPTGWNGIDAVATTIGGTDGSGTGAQVFQVEPGNADAEWYFDYQAGILYWVNENESGTLGASTSLTTDIAGTDKVYIQGYKYIGDFGVGGGIELTDFGVTSNSASGGGTLVYDDAGGFTYTPPDLSGFLESETSHADVVVDGDFTSQGIMLRGASAGSYSILADNSTNWNTAYGWGNHADANYLTSETSHADVLVDGDFTSQGIMLRGASAGSYSILADNSTNWNTAYGWGNHADENYLTSETSHADVVVDGDFTSQGIMLRGASAGSYSILTDNSANWNTAYSWDTAL
jgi:hypothetical protein